MKKILFTITVIILLLIINNLIHSIFEVWQKKDFVSEAEKELSFQKEENQRLKSQVSYSKTSEFIEKEARDKLFMVKKGEQRVLISRGEELVERQKESIPNWKQWFDLFF